MPNHVTSFDRSCRVIGRAAALTSLLLAFAAFIGCAEETGPGPIPLDELRSELRTATCDQYVRCGQMPDQATCTATEGDTRLTLQLLTDAVIGRVTYDEAEARKCIEAIRAKPCDNLLATRNALNTACAKMFVGTVPESGPCLNDLECAGDGVCDVSMCMGSGACCLGACIKAPQPVAIGGDCSTNPCVDSAYCDGAEMPPTCKARKDNGDACDAQGQCKDGQLCDVNGSVKTCYLLSKRGGICNPALDAGACLRYDDYCHPTDRKCTPLPGDGQPCTDKNECQDYAVCDAGTCRKRPVEGGACSDSMRCLGTLECNNMVCEVDVSTQVCAF